MVDDNTTTNDTTTTTAGKESTTSTSTADGQQAGDSTTTGAATQTATTTTEAKTETASTKIDTNSPEFKAALTAAIKEKIPQLQKQARKDVAKELSGEKEGEPTVDELKSKISEKDARLRVFEARDQLEAYVSDKRNQIQVRNLRGLFKLIKDDLKFDDDGNVTNFKEVIAAAKAEAGEFFGGVTPSIDAGIRSANGTSLDMNAWMRGGR